MDEFFMSCTLTHDYLCLIKHELMHISAPVSVTTNSAHLAIELFLILILILHVLL